MADVLPWSEFALALLVFLASHLPPARPRLRAVLCNLLGERSYLAVYSLVSLIVLGWLIVAARRAPFVEIWTFSPWQMWAPNIAMPAACLLIAFGVGASNPPSFGARHPAAFDPERPGIAGVTRHPLLMAIVVWAASHAIPNGDLAHVLLFGMFAVTGLLGMLVIDARMRARMGYEQWRRLAARTSLLPGAALITGRWQPDIRRPRRARNRRRRSRCLRTGAGRRARPTRTPQCGDDPASRKSGGRGAGEDGQHGRRQHPGAA